MTIPNAGNGIAYGPDAFRGTPNIEGRLYFAQDIGNGVMYQVQRIAGVLTWQAVAGVPISPIILSYPTLSGVHTVGSVLTSSAGTWSGDAIAFTYQWQRDGVDIAGQTATTHTIVSGDLGHALTCNVTATNSFGAFTTASTLAVVLATGTGTVAQVITLPSNGVKAFAANAAIPSDPTTAPFIQFPAPWSAVTDNPGVRVIIHNYSAVTPIQPTLLNADNSTFATFSLVEPGGGQTSLGIINETAAGVPVGALKLALLNIAVDPAAFNVYAKAWAV